MFNTFFLSIRYVRFIQPYHIINNYRQVFVTSFKKITKDKNAG